MRYLPHLAISAAILQPACATLSAHRSVTLGTLTGVTAGAGGGVLLSPNDESRTLNGLVFGLGGGLIGALVGALLEPGVRSFDGVRGDQSRPALSETFSKREFTSASADDLPAFVKERLLPTLVEEYTEADSLDEDGSLHEPHKVYRIKREAELIARPPKEMKPNQKRNGEE